MKTSAVLVLLAAAVAGAGAVGWFAARNHAAADLADPAASAEHSHAHSHAAHPTASAPAAADAHSAVPAARKVRFYRCPMHPQITSATPAKCTLCGMDLAPVFEAAATGPATATGAAGHDPENLVKLGTDTASLIGVETAPARVAPLLRTLRVSGVISDDETRHRVLSARVPGRIEKLHVNQVGLEVVRGQPLATIYSPDVLTAQRLYLENLRTGAGVVPASELASSREKLLALGLVEDDIRRLEQSGKPDSILVVRTPFDGTIITRGKANEGQYVNVNDELFEIGDFSALWFIFDAYERDLPALALNQKVDVSLPSRPGETITAPIAFIDPNLNEATRTARVRVVLPNPERRILYRQTATGVVRIEGAAASLLVPRSAVLHTREHPVAYVAAGEGAFEARVLRLGKIGDADAEVLDGLKAGERVVTQAALLVDSQAQLEHISGRAGNGAQPKEGEHPAPTATAKLAATPAKSATAVAASATAATATAPAPPTLSAALIAAAIDVTTALAADDLAAYKAALPALQTAVKQSSGAVRESLTPLVAKLGADGDLKSVRSAFEPFSNTLSGLVRALPPEGRPAKIFQCRMSPVLGTALWLQKDATGPRNPFFGAEMFECGAELK